MKNVGDIVFIEGTGDFYPGIECIVLEIDPEDGRVTKMKAAIPDERLSKMGFIIEGENWVVVEWNYSLN